MPRKPAPQHSAVPVAKRPVARPLVPIRVPIWALILVIAAATLLVSAHLRANAWVLSLALFVHIMSLVVGFGAVLSVDFQAAMWMLGRRKLVDVLRFGSCSHALIWLGLAGLVASGAVLHPDLDSTRARIKLILVLLVALNGVSVLGIMDKLQASLGRRPPNSLLLRAVAAVLISQGGWWGAATIGFLNAQSTSSTAHHARATPPTTGGLPARAPAAAQPSRSGQAVTVIS